MARGEPYAQGDEPGHKRGSLPDMRGSSTCSGAMIVDAADGCVRAQYRAGQAARIKNPAATP